METVLAIVDEDTGIVPRLLQKVCAAAQEEATKTPGQEHGIWVGLNDPVHVLHAGLSNDYFPNVDEDGRVGECVEDAFLLAIKLDVQIRRH